MAINIQVLIHQLIIFFIMIFIGYVAYTTRLLTSEMHDKLNTIIMRLIIPALLISNMALGSGKENIRLVFPMLIGGFGIFFLLYICGILVSRIFGQKDDLRKVQIGIITFGSTGFFGIPLVSALLGNTGTAALGIYSIVDNIMVWTLGLNLSTGVSENKIMSKRERLRNLVQPASIAVLIGLIFFIVNVPKHLLIFDVLSRIGNCSNPLAMICIGASIARSDITKLYKGWRAVSVLIIKMIFCPIIVFVLATKLNVYNPAKICLTFVTAIPTSSMFALMCKENNNDSMDYATRAAIITVLGSLVTFPVMLMIVKIIG